VLRCRSCLNCRAALSSAASAYGEHLSPRSRQRTCPAYLDGGQNRKASISPVSVSVSVRRLSVISSGDRVQSVLGHGVGSLRQASGLKRQPSAFSRQAFLILVRYCSLW
jgi:hypothetical protein